MGLKIEEWVESLYRNRSVEFFFVVDGYFSLILVEDWIFFF